MIAGWLDGFRVIGGWWDGFRIMASWSYTLTAVVVLLLLFVGLATVYYSKFRSTISKTEEMSDFEGYSVLGPK